MDKKLYKEVWTLCKRAPLLMLAGGAIWLPLEAMLQLLPLKSSSLTLEAARKAQVEALRQMDVDLPKEVANIKQAIKSKRNVDMHSGQFLMFITPYYPT